MPQMCYQQETTPSKCMREEVLTKVKKLVEEMGDKPVTDYRPICRKDQEPPKGRTVCDEHYLTCKCVSIDEPIRRPDYFQPVIFDGQLAKPIIPFNAINLPMKYCPPCTRKKPDMEPTLGCFTTGGRRRLNADRQTAGQKCSEKSLCTRTDYDWERKGYRLTGQEVGGDIGQTCPERNIHSVCSPFNCPNTPGHRHWSPACSACNYPNACYASCFEHPDYKDWTYRQPQYRFYLQRRWDKPFMPGY